MAFGEISTRIAEDLPHVINPIIAIAAGIGGSKSTAKGMEIVSSANFLIVKELSLI